MEQTNSGVEKVRGMRRGRPPKNQEDRPIVQEVAIVAEYATISPAQELCNRIWDGQSTDLPFKVRVNRIKLALSEKGFDPDSVVIG